MPLQGREGSHAPALVAAGELVFEADADVAAEGWDADHLLVVAVEEVGGADVEGKTALERVAAGDVEAGVACVACEAKAEKIAVGARAAEVASE